MLVQFATEGWPANGRVDRSEHPYDKVVDAEVDPMEDLMNHTAKADHHWRSPRRKAISALADMGNYQ